MPYFAEGNSAIAFLRSPISAQDISTNPVVIHPHNTSRTIPERLPPAIVKDLSQLDAARALAATRRMGLDCPLHLFLAPGALRARGYIHRRAPARADHHGTRRLALSLSAEPLAERALQQSLPDVAGVRLGRGLPQISLDASPIHKPAERWEPPHLVHPRRRGRACARLGLSQDEVGLGGL